MIHTEIHKPEYHFFLSHSVNDPFITMEVQGYMHGEDFKKNTISMFHFLKEARVEKLLVKARQLKLISHEDRTWLENLFLPFATAHGLKAVCFIKPEDHFAQTCIENVMYEIPEEQLKGAWYENYKEATRWLKNIPLE